MKTILITLTVATSSWLATGAASAQDEPLPQEVAQAYLAYEAAVEAGETEAAFLASRQAYEAALEMDVDPVTTGLLAENFATMSAALEDYAGAQRIWSDAARLADRNDLSAFDRAWRWHNAAVTAVQADDRGDAWSCSRRAVRALDEMDGEYGQARTFAAQAYYLRAQLAYGRSSVRESGAAAERVIELYERTEATPDAGYAFSQYYAGVGKLFRDDMEDAAYHFHMASDAMRFAELDAAVRRQADALSTYSFSHATSPSARHTSEAAVERLRDRRRANAIHEAYFLFDDEDEADAHPEGYVDAVALEREPPRYPLEAAREGFEGVVVVEYDVTEEGRVENAEILLSLPAGVFDRSIHSALEDWRYTPATQDGVPVRREDVTVHFSYRLR